MLLKPVKSFDLDIIIWIVMIAILFVFIWLIFYQRKKGRELAYELDQLGKMKQNNVESDFVLRAMNLATWHLDPRTMKLSIDRDYRDKNRWVADLVNGATITDMSLNIHPDDREKVTSSLINISQGRISDYHVEYRVLIPDTPNYYWEESFATIVERDVNGKPISIVGTTMRIDSRKTMEQALIETRNKAVQSDRMKTAFIANMSHEIRTPLNAIVGFTSILPDIEDKEERTTLLNLISENTQKLLRIIDDVMNISKIESGEDHVELIQFDANQVLAELADIAHENLKSGVELHTRFAEDEKIITTDMSRFNEIVSHLLSNATKFTDSGSIEIGYDTPVDGRISVWVKDTGIGIAEDKLEQVFDRFFKVDEFVPGAGLGLSTCRTMASSLGGSLTVVSSLGQGSTFTLDIPIR